MKKSGTLSRTVEIWISALTGALTLATFIVAFMTPPLSGPFCTEGCFSYPFTDITSRFPRDYYWMFMAIPQLLLYMLFVIVLYTNTAEDRKPYGLTSVVFAAISVTILLIDYFLQLAVIQPSLIRGETEGIALLTQYNPHGIFIALEELGYLLMGFTFLWISLTYEWKGRLSKTLKGLNMTGFILSVASLITIVLIMGHDREYIFEIAIISIVWIILIITSLLHSVFLLSKE